MYSGGTSALTDHLEAGLESSLAIALLKVHSGRIGALLDHPIQRLICSKCIVEGLVRRLIIQWKD